MTPAAATVIRALPQPPARPAECTAYIFGSQILIYLIEHRCTALLTDEDLEAARHAALYAVASREIDARALETIQDARRLAVDTLAARVRDRRQLADQAAQIATGAGPADRPNDGPMARLQPQPKTNPPAPAYATPEPRRPVTIDF